MPDTKWFERAEARLVRMEENIYQIHGGVEALKVKAGVWGAVAGLVVSVGAILVGMAVK